MSAQHRQVASPQASGHSLRAHKHVLPPGPSGVSLRALEQMTEKIPVHASENRPVMVTFHPLPICVLHANQISTADIPYPTLTRTSLL